MPSADLFFGSSLTGTKKKKTPLQRHLKSSGAGSGLRMSGASWHALKSAHLVLDSLISATSIFLALNAGFLINIFWPCNGIPWQYKQTVAGSATTLSMA